MKELKTIAHRPAPPQVKGRTVWVICAEFPSGTRYAFSSLNESFALAVIEESGVCRGAHFWDTEAEAKKVLDEYERVAPELLRKLNPRVEPMYEAASALAEATPVGPLQ